MKSAPDRRLESGAASLSVTLGARVCVTRAHASTIELKGKAATVVAMTGLEGCVDRRRVALLLWPDTDERQARNNLRTLLHRINRQVDAVLLDGAERLVMNRAPVRLALQEADVVLRSLGDGRLNECEFLSEVALGSNAGAALVEWLRLARQRLRRAQLQSLCDAHSHAQANADAARAIALARACVQLESLSERWHRQLMMTLARFGDRAAALVAYEDLKRLLLDRLGAMPDPQTRIVQVRILQDQALD